MVSQHRYLCPAEPPRSPADISPLAEAMIGGRFGHQHQCMHDADPFRTKLHSSVVEHECECGMKWVDRPIQYMIHIEAKPPPGRTIFDALLRFKRRNP